MWPDICTAVKRFILLIEFYFLVVICFCLDCVIIRYNFILGSYWDCTRESDKIRRVCFLLHTYRHPVASGALRWICSQMDMEHWGRILSDASVCGALPVYQSIKFYGFFCLFVTLLSATIRISKSLLSITGSFSMC